MTNLSNRVLNDDLALLSLRAAEEVDRRLKGKNSQPNIFRNLGQKLTQASGINEGHSTASLYADPATAEIFAQAVSEAYSKSVSDIDDLSKIIQDVIKPLISKEMDLSSKELSEVKTFCLAFHRSLMAQNLPPHPDQDVLEDEFRFV